MLGNDTEIFRTDHDIQTVDGLAGKFREETVGDQQRPGFGVFDDHVELLAREVGQNRHGDHAGRGDGKITDAPVGHVAAQQGDLVPGTKPRGGQDLLHTGNTTAHFSISHILAVEHRVGDPRCELLHTVANQFVQGIDNHDVFCYP